MGNDTGGLFKDKGVLSFTVVIAALILLSVLYFIMHSYMKGEVYITLSDSDKTALTLILNNSQDDSLTAAAARQKAMKYIVKELVPIDTAGLYSSYESLDNIDFIAALPSIRVLTSSYFWLHGEGKYLEVIFWSIFGVLTSLLYFASEAMRLNKFRVEETSVYLAKVFYAPFIAIIIVFSFKILTAAGDMSLDDSSIELLIFSFVVGFFSGRAIDLLNKIKEIILPGRDKPEERPTGQVILTGRVSVPDDNVDFTAVKAKITLYSSLDKTEIAAAETNDDRIYFFKNISPGSYDIKAELKSGDDSFIAEITDRKLIKDKPVEIENIELIKTEPATANTVILN
jgi:hypothetical protein